MISYGSFLILQLNEEKRQRDEQRWRIFELREKRSFNINEFRQFFTRYPRYSEPFSYPKK